VRNLRQTFAVAAVLALAACTQMYFKDFAVEPQDKAYTAREQFDDFRAYLRSRGLRTVIETNNLLEVEIEPGDMLRVRLTPEPKVELTLVRTTKGSDFTAGELRRFQESFAGRMRERTGQPVTIRLVEERTKPMSNVRFQ
jgi:hypothetical protein